MPFTEAEKRKWHADRRTGRDRNDQTPVAACAHCGAPVGFENANSDFPLCAACDGD
jgi:hypothetical protein